MLLCQQLPLLGGRSSGSTASRGLCPPGCLPNTCLPQPPTLHPLPGITFLKTSTCQCPAEMQLVVTFPPPLASLQVEEDLLLT